MPADIIPLMAIISGILITGIGIWSSLNHLLGLSKDHAHILPNLRILKENQINILVDGSSADSSEFLNIESDQQYVIERLKEVGADSLNICTPGCDTHRILPFKVVERQSFQLLKLAVETGAVEAVVCRRLKIMNKVKGSVRKSLPVEFYSSIDSTKDAEGSNQQGN